MKAQTKKLSIAESIVNVIAGYFVSVFGQYLIFPILGIFVDVKINFAISFFIMFLSFAKCYIVRRVFNFIGGKK